MKLNKNGFMMAEVVVVSAIILTFLASIFISYNKIYSAYKTRIDYYDVTAVYRLNFYREYYTEYMQNCSTLGRVSIYDCKLSQAKNNGRAEYSNPDDENVKEKVFIFYNNYNNLAQNALSNASVNLTYKDYVNYLATSLDLTDSSYIMTIERCETTDNDACKYAYLKIYDEVTSGE